MANFNISNNSWKPKIVKKFKKNHKFFLHLKIIKNLSHLVINTSLKAKLSIFDQWKVLKTFIQILIKKQKNLKLLTQLRVIKETITQRSKVMLMNL